MTASTSHPGRLLRFASLRSSDGYAWCVAASWFALSLAGLWTYEVRQANSERSVLFELHDTAQVERWYSQTIAGMADVANSAPATVISLAGQGCPCEASAAPRFAQIRSRYQSRGVRFLVPDATSRSDPRLAALTSGQAALVFDRKGRLAYYGPYAEAAACGVGRGLLEPILDRVLSGRFVTSVPVVGLACACT